MEKDVEQQEESRVGELPHEVMLGILGWLSGRDLLVVGASCWLFRRPSLDETLWQRHCQAAPEAPVTTWRLQFVHEQAPHWDFLKKLAEDVTIVPQTKKGPELIITVHGYDGSGRRSLISRMLSDKFEDDAFINKNPDDYKVDEGTSFRVRNSDVMLSPMFKLYSYKAYQGIHEPYNPYLPRPKDWALIFVWDLTQSASTSTRPYNDLLYYLEKTLRTQLYTKPLLVLGNKADVASGELLVEQTRKILKEINEVRERWPEQPIYYLEVSAKTGRNVEMAHRCAAGLISLARGRTLTCDLISLLSGKVENDDGATTDVRAGGLVSETLLKLQRQ